MKANGGDNWCGPKKLLEPMMNLNNKDVIKKMFMVEEVHIKINKLTHEFIK